ncbi:ROK family protein [Nonomuraea ferruginea]
MGGADGFAGIGHAMIDPSGARCRCGRLCCRETEVGLAALVGTATPDRPYGTGPQVVRDTEERLAEIEQRRADGDPHAEAEPVARDRRGAARTGPTSISIRTSPAVGAIEGTPTVRSPRSP